MFETRAPASPLERAGWVAQRFNRPARCPGKSGLVGRLLYSWTPPPGSKSRGTRFVVATERKVRVRRPHN